MAVDHVLLPEEFGGDVEKHVDTGDEIFVPAQVLGEPVAEDCRRGCEDRVVGRDEEHRPRHVRRAAEGELPVQREVPQDAEGQCDEIGRPVRPVQQLVQQGETADLDDSGTGRKQHELEESPGLFHGRSGNNGAKLGKNALGFPRLFRNFGEMNH